MKHYLQAQIDLSAIEHNCLLLKSFAPGCKICVAVKANAYGHGVKLVLRVMEKIKADMLAVACIQEARELRELHWKGPVLLFGSEFSIYRAAEQNELAKWIVENEIRPTLCQTRDAEILSQAAKQVNKDCLVHVAMDSGMSRMGLTEDQLWRLIQNIQALPKIKIEGIYTHFATADCIDKTFAQLQLSRFGNFLERLKNAGIEIPIIHASNSAASFDLPKAHFNMIRPGISVYGYHASNELPKDKNLRPAMKLVSFLTLIKNIPAESYVGYGCTFKTARPTTIGIVPIGYADGYSRELSNKAKMLIAGKTVPVIGRVSMDQTIIDLTDLQSSPNVGDEVIIYDNDPISPNSIENIAQMLGTIPYVITTSLGKRVQTLPALRLTNIFELDKL